MFHFAASKPQNILFHNISDEPCFLFSYSYHSTASEIIKVLLYKFQVTETKINKEINWHDP